LEKSSAGRWPTKSAVACNELLVKSIGFAENFEDLQIWQRSRVLTNEIYDAFEKCRDLDLRSQLRRASVSVMNNIAEGFERRTKKDFAHFLDLSKGSSGEVRSMLYLAEDRRYLDKSSAEQLRVDYKDLSKSIGALASKLRSQQ
jgi:four helix bundle protein